MDETAAPDAPGEDRREPYVPPAVTWVEPLGHQAALMVSCGRQVGGSEQCYVEPKS
jgi:hypothetical protein